MSLENKFNQESKDNVKVVATEILVKKLEEQAIEKTTDKIATGCISGLKYFGIAIDLSAGFYVGYHDGAGVTLDSALKTALLTTPAAMSGIKSALLGYSSKSVWERVMEVKGVAHKEKLEQELNKDLTWPEYNSLMKDYDSKIKKISVPYAAGKDSLKAVMGTGIGYALGYIVAKFS